MCSEAPEQLLVKVTAGLAQVIEGIGAGGGGWKALDQLAPVAVGTILLSQFASSQRLLFEHHWAQQTVTPSLPAQ